MRAEDLVAAKVDLSTRVLRGDFQSMTRRQLKMFGQEYFNNFNTLDLDGVQQMASAMAAAMYLAIIDTVQDVPLYRVTPDMSSLVDYAANDLGEEVQCDPDLAPSESGLVRFERPIILHDYAEHEIKLHWMLWTPLTAGYTNEEWADQFGADDAIMPDMRRSKNLFFFTDTTDPDDIIKLLGTTPENRRRITDVLGGFKCIAAELYRPWNTVGPRMTILDGSREVRYLNTETGEVGSTPTQVVGDQALMSGPYENLSRIAHALWLLMDQKVTSVETENVRKHHRQLAERAEVSSNVSVVALRNRAAGPPARKQGESTVAWAKRWPVRAHWRNARVGEGRAETRRVWVSAHVKGPADKPLDARPRVYDVRPDPKSRSNA